MATVYLEPIDLSFTIKSPNSTLYGTGGSQAITITPTASNITADQNVEEIILQKTSSEYLYQQTGNVLKIYESGNPILSIALQGDDDGTKVAFSNGYAYAKLVSGVMSLGGISIGSAVSAITPTLNTSDSTTQPNESSESVDELLTQLLPDMFAYNPIDTSATTIDSSLKNGIFVDSVVEGIRYKSTSADGLQTKEGVTSVFGGYKYFDGGKTEFFVGNNISLGEASSSEIVTIKDITDNEQEATNILRFIQTLDSDNKPSNGIVISDQTINEINNSGAMIDFNISATQFEDTYSILSLSLSDPTSLVGTAKASEHAMMSDAMKEIVDTPLGKALSNNLSFEDDYYNTYELYSSQEKRLKLYVWQEVVSKNMDIEIDLMHSRNENVDSIHNVIAAVLDIADAGLAIQSMTKSVDGIVSNGKPVATAYATYLTKGVQGFSVGYKSFKAVGSTAAVFDSEEDVKSEPIWDAFVDNLIGGTADFMEKALPVVVSQIGVVGKNFRVTKPDPVSLFLSVSKIANDVTGSYFINSNLLDINNVFVAKMWIGAYMRAGMDKDYMDYMLTGEHSKYLTQEAQIKLLGDRNAISRWGKDYDVSTVKTIIDRYLTHLNENYDVLSKYVQAISDDNTNEGWLNLDYETKSNHSPIANPDKVVSDASGVFIDTVLANDTDEDGDSLTILDIAIDRHSIQGFHGQVSLSQGVIHYIPDAGYVGTDTLYYEISDAFGGYATGKIDITVTGDGETATQPTIPLEIRLVSSNSSGVGGNSSSVGPSISSDGRYVAFDSTATNLVDGDTNSSHDIFLKDTKTGAIKLISSSSSGVVSNSSSVGPSISSDGRYVAFDSTATNLVDGDTNSSHDIFLKDTQTGAIKLISSSSSGVVGNVGYSSDPSISSDGRYISFNSAAPNLVDGDTNASTDIFLKDTQTGAIKLISSSSINGNSYLSSISSDARYVAFQSYASNLVDGDTNSNSDIFLKDTQTGAIKLISSSSSGVVGNGYSSEPSISSDGRYVAFESYAANLVDGDTNRSQDIFLKDTQTGVIKLVSSNSSGVIGSRQSGDPSISSDGRYVAFHSDASNLVDGDTNNSPDIFVKDIYTGVIKLISKNSSGVIGNDYSYTPSISADGRYISFSSDASNFVDGDTNTDTDIFIVGNPLYDSSIV